MAVPMNMSNPGARTKRLRRLLESTELEFLCSAHNGISARIAEEAGFKALWGGGLSISAQLGVRDSNEASWTQVLEVLEFMADATSLPILVDGDTGHGNFNNFRRLVRKLEQRSLAGVCIEDKVFPKTNSFIDGSKQRLAEIDEFCGRIKAGCDSRRDPDFCIVARTEAFIAGWGLNEALRRAVSYREAGADAILIHSALEDATEVLAFKEAWGDRCPVVIVPTTYWRTPVDVFRRAGFSLAIWANHLLRAGVVAMRECAEDLVRGQSPAVEARIASLQEIFRLQGAPELKQAERRYLPVRAIEPRVVVLPASRGAGPAVGADGPPLEAHRPAASVLTDIVAAYNAAGFRRIAVVRGPRDPSAAPLGVDDVSPKGDTTGEVAALRAALAGAADGDRDLYVSFSHVLFDRYILDALAGADADFAIVAEVDWREGEADRSALGYVNCTEPRSRRVHRRRVALVAAGQEADALTDGEWTGFLRVAARALPRLRQRVDEILTAPGGGGARLCELLSSLVQAGETVRVLYTLGHWSDASVRDEEPAQVADRLEPPATLHERRRAEAPSGADAGAGLL